MGEMQGMTGKVRHEVKGVIGGNPLLDGLVHVTQDSGRNTLLEAVGARGRRSGLF